MKIHPMFHVFTLLIVSLIFSMPLLTLAQENPIEPAQSEQVQAIQDAERDAEAHINKGMWFGIGCIFPGVGLLAPYFYQPPPPTSALLGKSPEYIAYYTDTYKRKTQNLQFTSALGGQATFCVGYCVLGVASGFFTALASEF